jgi:hypothetical protein
LIISGIDPGRTGAMVTLFEDGSTVVDRVPLIKVERAKKAAIMKPDWKAWGALWRMSVVLNAPDVFVMEDVHGWKGQAAGASFSFGKAMGFALASIMAHDAPIHYAPPGVWKIKLGLMGMDKAASVVLARSLIPSLIPELIERRGNPADVRGGVAEAGLLAYYAKMTISG